MAWILQVTFLSTGQVEKHYSLDGAYYILEDGSRVDVHTAIIWCNHCNKVSCGEPQETLEGLDTAIAELNNPETELGHYFLKMYPKREERERIIGEHRSELLVRKQWLTKRVSPARCFICGQTDLISLMAPDGVETPAGKVVVRITGHAYVVGPRSYFSPEGERLEYNLPPAQGSSAAQDESKRPTAERKWWQFWK